MHDSSSILQSARLSRFPTLLDFQREASRREALVAPILTTLTKPILLSELWIQTKGEPAVIDAEGNVVKPAVPAALIPFEPNGVQIAYMDELIPDWREGRICPYGLREIILKSRQFGFSTLIAALFFLMTINNTDINTVIIADCAKNSEGLFAKMRTFYEQLPKDRQPRTRYNSRRELDFAELRSKIGVLTAGKDTAGRSMTIQNLHCSEVPFWNDPKLLTGLLQSVPESGNIFIESTANGEDEIFCVQYRKAAGQVKLDPGEESVYNARFFAWFDHKEYEKTPPHDFTRTDDEITVANKHELDSKFGTERTDRKLFWRRRKMAEPGMGTLFGQEYPGDDKEAFLVSGTRFFTEWDEGKHTFLPGEETPERFYQWFGGYDWGIGAPACFLLAYADDKGRVRVVDEVYGADRTDPEQARDVVACLARWNKKPADVPIYSDSAMWAEKRDQQVSGKKIANILAFHLAGLRMVATVKGPNSRRHGGANMKRYLHDFDPVIVEGIEKPGVPFLKVSRACPNLIRTMKLMVRDKDNPEVYDTDTEDHAVDACVYLLASKPRPSEDPRAPKPVRRAPDKRDPAEVKRKEGLRKL